LSIGGGVSISYTCLGDLQDKNFAADKEIGVFTRKSSSLQEAVCNAYGIKDHWARFVRCKRKHLSQLYPNIAQIIKRKNLRIEGQSPDHGDDKQKHNLNNRSCFIGAANLSIDGLYFVEGHIKNHCQKTKVNFNTDPGIYVARLLRDGSQQWR
jgi:hypothetical protein